MPVAPLATVVRNKGRTMGGIRPPRQIPDTIQGSSSPPRKIPGSVPNVPAGFGARSCSPGRDQDHDGERGSRDSSRPRPWFLQPPVPSRKVFGRLETRNRPLAPERVRSSNTIQDGNNQLGSSCGQERRLPRLDRPQGRLLSDPRKLLRFISNGTVYQFRALCFGLLTAPKVFTRVFAVVSSWAHSRGVRLLRYLDDWLILSSSEAKTRQHVKQLLALCRSLGIVINEEKSDFSPSRSVEYLGMIIDKVSARASPPRLESRNSSP